MQAGVQTIAVPLYNASNKRKCIIPKLSRVVVNYLPLRGTPLERVFLDTMPSCACCSGLLRVGGLALIMAG